tara:strand:+ start:2403 stop:2903 length:501 start_codon:yes stop_codon:yes gene_type:complete
VGIGMTPELGARPWQNPPQLVKIEDVISHYVEVLSTDEASMRIANILDMGVPVTTLANTIQINNVMEGLHTIDTGIMATPAIMEYIMLIGDSQNIKYNTGLEQPEGSDREMFIKRAMAELISKEQPPMDTGEQPMMPQSEMSPPEMAQEEPMPTEEAPVGLMSRRA